MRIIHADGRRPPGCTSPLGRVERLLCHAMQAMPSAVSRCIYERSLPRAPERCYGAGPRCTQCFVLVQLQCNIARRQQLGARRTTSDPASRAWSIDRLLTSM